MALDCFVASKYAMDINESVNYLTEAKIYCSKKKGCNMLDKTVLKVRDEKAHKGDFGKVLVVAGSVGMAGAAMMCGKAAVKSGAGLVKFAVPEELFHILQIGVPEATCLIRDFDNVINIHDFEAITLGSGIGVNKANISVIKTILNEYTGKLILDADGLNCVMKYSLYGNLKQSKADVVLTPHLGEAARLLEVEKIGDDERMNAAKEIQGAFNKTVVMKGANTYVVDDSQIYVNDTGNPGMATGGSGDVLAGIIAALAAQGYSAYEAAKIGVYVHGLAGDICAEEIGQIGMTAMDICEKVPAAFKLLQETEPA